MKKKESENRNIPNADIQQQMVPEVYSNTALISTSPYEFEITLGLGSSNYQGVKPVVNLRMSPQFVKEFAKTLVENLNLFEETHGKIKLPKGGEESN
jgi:hypothetical protein